MSPWKIFDRNYRITSIERRIIDILGHWQAEISEPGYWHVRTDSGIFSILVVNLQSRGNYQCLCETAGINYYKRTGRGNSPMRSQRAACSTNVDLFDSWNVSIMILMSPIVVICCMTITQPVRGYPTCAYFAEVIWKIVTALESAERELSSREFFAEDSKCAATIC